jgi:hypothetical protein
MKVWSDSFNAPVFRAHACFSVVSDGSAATSVVHDATLAWLALQQPVVSGLLEHASVDIVLLPFLAALVCNSY